MRTEIKRWGSSAVVRLPATMLSELSLSVGSPIELKLVNSKLVIEPVRSMRKDWFTTPLSENEAVFENFAVDAGDEEWQW